MAFSCSNHNFTTSRLGTFQRAKSLPPLTSVNVVGTSISLPDNIKILGLVFNSKLSFNLHFSKVIFLPYLLLFGIFVQLVLMTPPRPTWVHLLVATSTTPTLYFLVRCQKTLDVFIESKAIWHELLHNSVDESTSRRRSKTYTGFLSSTALTSRWQHSYTRFYNPMNRRTCRQ